MDNMSADKVRDTHFEFEGIENQLFPEVSYFIYFDDSDFSLLGGTFRNFFAFFSCTFPVYKLFFH